MFRRTQKSSYTSKVYHQGQHRFEHWYRDNQVYFITARCRERYPAFACERAKAVFWDRFEYWTQSHQFTPWIISLLDNHYHMLGYCTAGETLGRMMQRIHGSVAKLVNDLLLERRLPFWREAGNKDYFDGCIRDEKQCRRAYRYVRMQSVRHGACADWREYPHTKIYVDLESAIRKALELKAFLEGVPYRRYQKHRRGRLSNHA